MHVRERIGVWMEVAATLFPSSRKEKEGGAGNSIRFVDKKQQRQK